MEDSILKKAMNWCKQNYPDSSLSHKCAFAGSVEYLVQGCCSGYGGPSLRQHLCSRRSTNGEQKFAIGKWHFEDAIRFCAPLCFEPAEIYRQELLEIQESEYCFDDDPNDLEELCRKRCLVCGKLLAKQARRSYCSKHTNHDPIRKQQIREIQKRWKQ